MHIPALALINLVMWTVRYPEYSAAKELSNVVYKLLPIGVILNVVVTVVFEDVPVSVQSDYVYQRACVSDHTGCVYVSCQPS